MFRTRRWDNHLATVILDAVIVEAVVIASKAIHCEELVRVSHDPVATVGQPIWRFWALVEAVLCLGSQKVYSLRPPHPRP